MRLMSKLVCLSGGKMIAGERNASYEYESRVLAGND